MMELGIVKDEADTGTFKSVLAAEMLGTWKGVEVQQTPDDRHAQVQVPTATRIQVDKGRQQQAQG